MVRMCAWFACVYADKGGCRYLIHVRQIAKFVVGLHDKVAPTDIEEGMRVGVDRAKYQIHLPLPPKIDASVTMMQVRCACMLVDMQAEPAPAC